MSKKAKSTFSLCFHPAQLPEVLSGQIRQIVELSEVNPRDRAAVLSAIYDEFQTIIDNEDEENEG